MGLVCKNVQFCDILSPLIKTTKHISKFPRYIYATKSNLFLINYIISTYIFNCGPNHTKNRRKITIRIPLVRSISSEWINVESSNFPRVKGILMQIWKSANIFVFIWKCWRFQIKTPFTFIDMRTWDMWKVCLQTFRNNRIC